MKINIFEIGPLNNGECIIVFDGENHKGLFGLSGCYYPKEKRLKLRSVSPRQPLTQFIEPAMEAIAKEPVAYFT